MFKISRPQLVRPAMVRRMLFHSNPRSRLLQEAKQQSKSGDAATSKKKGGIKELMSKYGYSALGIYLAISAIDLPLSFLLVHSMGQERIVEVENSVKRFFGFSTELADSPIVASVEGDGSSAVTIDKEGSVVISGNQTKQEEGWRAYFTPTFLTEFGIAYALHKSLIFIRVPITAAITPKAVLTLQRWGFNVGKKATSVAK